MEGRSSPLLTGPTCSSLKVFLSLPAKGDLHTYVLLPFRCAPVPLETPRGHVLHRVDTKRNLSSSWPLFPAISPASPRGPTQELITGNCQHPLPAAIRQKSRGTP